MPPPFHHLCPGPPTPETVTHFLRRNLTSERISADITILQACRNRSIGSHFRPYIIGPSKGSTQKPAGALAPGAPMGLTPWCLYPSDFIVELSEKMTRSLIYAISLRKVHPVKIPSLLALFVSLFLLACCCLCPALLSDWLMVDTRRVAGPVQSCSGLIASAERLHKPPGLSHLLQSPAELYWLW